MKFKKRVLKFGYFSIFFVFTACGGGSNHEGHYDGGMPSEHGSMSKQYQHESKTDMHVQHNSLAENFAHKDIIILDHPYQTSETTKRELEGIVNVYLQIKDALVKDDEHATDKAAVLMANKVAAIIPSKLEGKGLKAWQNHQVLYKVKLREMQHIKGLDNKRSYFSHISEIMYCTIKSFGLKQGNLFVIFCPMAFDGKGAYWISDSKTIQNPYLGSKMPTCGEVKEEL